MEGNLVEFRFYRPQAQEVHVVGDFNGWQPGRDPMRRRDDGQWQARLELPPGTFKFRYYADGRWFTDFAAFGIEYGPFGPDGIVTVPSAAVPRRD
jgi:1,4-alpha-glucan branching enzyme